jgi:hypothetical protein
MIKIASNSAAHQMPKTARFLILQAMTKGRTSRCDVRLLSACWWSGDPQAPAQIGVLAAPIC